MIPQDPQHRGIRTKVCDKFFSVDNQINFCHHDFILSISNIGHLDQEKEQNPIFLMLMVLFIPHRLQPYCWWITGFTTNITFPVLFPSDIQIIIPLLLLCSNLTWGEWVFILMLRSGRIIILPSIRTTTWIDFKRLNKWNNERKNNYEIFYPLVLQFARTMNKTKRPNKKNSPENKFRTIPTLLNPVSSLKGCPRQNSSLL